MRFYILVDRVEFVYINATLQQWDGVLTAAVVELSMCLTCKISVSWVVSGRGVTAMCCYWEVQATTKHWRPDRTVTVTAAYSFSALRRPPSSWYRMCVVQTKRLMRSACCRRVVLISSCSAAAVSFIVCHWLLSEPRCLAHNASTNHCKETRQFERDDESNTETAQITSLLQGHWDISCPSYKPRSRDPILTVWTPSLFDDPMSW